MKKIQWNILLQLTMILLFLGGTGFLVYKELYFSGFLCFVVVLGLLYKVYTTFEKVLKKVEQTLEAVAKEDYSVKITPKNLPYSIYKALNKILHLQKEKNRNNISTKIIYENIIESVDTGILILQEINNEIEIFYSNKAFADLLEIPRFLHWKFLQQDLVAFSSYLDQDQWKDQRNVITLSINGKEQECSIRTFLTTLYEVRYLIVNIDPLQSIIDRKEKEAWFNLMKVMSHEILNTITPISSLSNNLEYLIKDSEKELGEDFEDVYHSVLTIKNRTQHLLDFVNTYRSLTELPTPQKKAVNVKRMVQNSLQILSSLIREKQIEVRLKVEPENAVFFLDEKQMEQVMINLLTNSIYALNGIENPCITINVLQTEDQNIMEVIDNGIGIAPDIKRQVFVPFFTTRKNGSGIGLSLSKNIVNAHEGHIRFVSDEHYTKFSIIL